MHLHSPSIVCDAHWASRADLLLRGVSWQNPLHSRIAARHAYRQCRPAVVRALSSDTEAEPSTPLSDSHANEYASASADTAEVRTPDAVSQEEATWTEVCLLRNPSSTHKQTSTHTCPGAGSLWAALSNRLHTDVQSVQATPVERHVGASVSAQPEPEPCSACPPLGITSTGVIWALTIIAGVRLGRAESERNRLDLWRQVLSDLI